MEQNIFDFELQANLCQSLGHITRLRIVNLLEGGALPVNTIASSIEIPQPTASRHLALLRSNGVLDSHRKGTEIFYEISNPKILEVCELMREVLTEQEFHRAEIFNLPND